MSTVPMKYPHHLQLASEALTQFSSCYEAWNKTKQIKYMSKQAIFLAKTELKQAQEYNKRVLETIEKDKYTLKVQHERNMAELNLLHDFIHLYHDQSRTITAAIIENPDMAHLLEPQLTTMHSMFMALGSTLKLGTEPSKSLGTPVNLLSQKINQH